MDGDTNDGGSWYTPDWPWVNILKTGNLLYEMGLVGDSVETPRVKDAVDYIERHWNDPGAGDVGWWDHRQTMFTMMKGFESLGIKSIDLDGDGVAEHDWFEEVALHLIGTQDPGGWWPWDPWANEILSTAWALLTLERAVPIFEIPVGVDIKPGSCPNPLNLKERGLLTAAVLGTPEFDVIQIDPSTIVLLNPVLADPIPVPPVRWALEDVATPYDPAVGGEGAYACTTAGPDDYMDLTLKFDSQAVVAALGMVGDGEVLVLKLAGKLKEEFGGVPISGGDVVLILAKQVRSTAVSEQVFLPLLVDE
jgi:hypothetical protein